jgi:hypothetical protein
MLVACFPCELDEGRDNEVNGAGGAATTALKHLRIEQG